MPEPSKYSPKPSAASAAPRERTTREHAYGDPVAVPSENYRVATCSSCGATRAEMTYGGGKRTLYRVQADGRAFGKELPCAPIDKLLALARNAAASKPEALTAAFRAVALVREHHLVWHPEPSLLANAIALYDTASTETDRREAALAIARSCKGSILVTEEERVVLRKPGKQQESVEELPSFLFQSVLGIAREVMSRFSVNFEVSEGVTLGDAGATVRRTIDDVRDETERFRREWGELFGTAGKPGAVEKPSKVPRRPAAAKPVPKRASPRRTTPVSKKAAPPRKKGSRTR